MNEDQMHNVETWFGAADSGDGTPFRFVKATMSNMYVKLGEIPDDDQVVVTYPDGHQEIKDIGDTVDLSNLDPITKDNYKVATMTFKYQDEVTPDAYGYVYKTYTQNGWDVTNDSNVTTNYAEDGIITLTENISILPGYIESTIADDFPDDPTRENYTFNNWQDANKTVYTSYLGEDDITFYADWTETVVYSDPLGTTISVPSGSIVITTVSVQSA